MSTSMMARAMAWVRATLKSPGPRRSMVIAGFTVVMGPVALALVLPSEAVPTSAVPEVQPVLTTTFVCPDFRGAARVARTSITAVVPQGLAQGLPKAGRAQLVLPTRRGRPKVLGQVTRPGGGLVLAAARTAEGPVVGAASGWLAPGFSASQITTQFSGVDRGLAGVDCADVTSEAWFVGGGAASGQRTFLILVNPERTAATADVEFFGMDGPLDAPGGRGIVVPSKGARIVAVDSLVPGIGTLVIHVTASVGRLAMAVRTTDRRGSEPLGTDFVPVAEAPAQRLVVPALPKGTGARALLVVNPGNDDAQIRLKVIGRSGSFAPAGANSFTVRAGSVRVVLLSDIIDSENVGLLLESDQKVTAGVRVRFRGSRRGQAAEYGWSAAVAPVTTTAVEPSSRVGEGYNAQLLLSCPQGECRVRVRYGPPGRRWKQRDLTIASGITITVPLAGRGDRGLRSLTVQPLPGSAPVYAGRVQTGRSPNGVLLTIAPLRDARISVGVPPAQPDASVVIPQG